MEDTPKRKGLRDRINPSGMPWTASKKSSYTEEPSPQYTKSFDGFKGIH